LWIQFQKFLTDDHFFQFFVKSFKKQYMVFYSIETTFYFAKF
jgi:hypothetical protein